MGFSLPWVEEMVRPAHRPLAVVALTISALGSIAAGVQLGTGGHVGSARGTPARMLSRPAAQVIVPRPVPQNAAFARVLVPAVTGRSDIIPVSAPVPQSVPAPGLVAEAPIAQPPTGTPPGPDDGDIVPEPPVPVPEALQPIVESVDDAAGTVVDQVAPPAGDATTGVSILRPLTGIVSLAP